MSHNSLDGSIGVQLDGLVGLKSLKLASNHFTGSLPSQLDQTRHHLRTFDVSYNNLSGPIPRVLRRFNYEDFEGNPNLCGEPLPISCSILEGAQGGEPQNESKDNGYYIGLYVSLGLGFYFGFWAVCGTLTLQHSWRYAFFNFVDTVYNRIYVIIAIYVARFRRNSQT